jgi:hypothetical protein
MVVLYTLVHRETGPLATYETAVDAGVEMARLVIDESESLDALSIEAVASADTVPHAE